MRSRSLLHLAALAVVASLVAACAGSGSPGPTGAGVSPTAGQPSEAATEGPWEPEFVDGELQPLPDGFPNQPLTFIVVDEAGSDDGIYARNFQAALDGVSPVRIDVVDRPDLGANFGTWEALKYTAEQPGGNDGYLMVVASVTGTTMDLLTTPVAQDLSVSIDDMNWVVVTEQVPWLMVTRSDAPWGTDVEQFAEYAKAHPGEVRWISRGTGSAVTFSFAHYQRLLGIELNEIIGGSIEDVLLAVGAGEGDVAMNVTGSTMAFVDTGRVKVMSCTGNNNPCPGFDVVNAATVAGIQGDDPWGSSRGLLVPPDVDDLHRAWLAALLLEANKNADFQVAREQLPGLVLTDFDHAKAGELAQFIYDTAYDIAKDAGVLDPSVP
jgi:tripartite-type tricarboxylate transporter receptor subunit TctC